MPTLFFPAWFVAILLLLHAWRVNRRLSRERHQARLDAARFHRHMERLTMVLGGADREKLAHTIARSDMEWQQAVKALRDDALPVFFPLEPSFMPIAPHKDAV